MKRDTAFRVVGLSLIVAFTLFVIMDSFVISRAVSREAQANTTIFKAVETDDTTTLVQMSASTVEASNADVPSDAVLIGEYSCDEYEIKLYSYRRYDSTVYAADVKVSSAQYLKTALANGSYGKNIKANTSSIAQSVGAVLAINGDFYGAHEQGYVIRNGVLYRSAAATDAQALCIYADGGFGKIEGGEVSAQSLLDEGAWQVLSFGPFLVYDGEISVGVNDEVDKAMASNPRTAIGIIDECHYILLVSDGRTSESEGLSLYELAQVMAELGCESAYNLDGGGSSTMYFMGEVVNKPTSGHGIKERSVSDIVYIG